MNNKKLWWYGGGVLALCIVAVMTVWIVNKVNAQTTQTDSIFDIDKYLGEDETTPPPAAVPATPQEVASQPKDTTALGGYDVLIADRGNNRIIEVTPNKKIVWEYTCSFLLFYYFSAG